jgi:hypothetical protein
MSDMSTGMSVDPGASLLIDSTRSLVTAAAGSAWERRLHSGVATTQEVACELSSATASSSRRLTVCGRVALGCCGRRVRGTEGHSSCPTISST